MEGFVLPALGVPKRKGLEWQSFIWSERFPLFCFACLLGKQPHEQGMFWYKYIARGSQNVSCCQEHPKQSLECFSSPGATQSQLG